MKRYGLLLAALALQAQDYPPGAGFPGTTAIHKDSPEFVGWATGISVVRGHVNIANPTFTAGGSNFATSGQPDNALGYPGGNSTVSLGDGGSAVLTFASPIVNEAGFDLAVFENGASTYLELAFVEASSDGIHFFRFPGHSQTQTNTQIGSFGTPSATYLNNLAGKYEALYGTPFDLSELPDDPLLDKNAVTHIKVIDVVGSIDPAYAGYDSLGNPVNDSFPTPFTSSGFDLQAVGVIHQQTLGLTAIEWDSVSIFPNPARAVLHVKGICDFSAIIFDGSGRIVLEQQHSSESVDLSKLPTGVYLLEIRSADRKKVIRLVKT